MRYISCTEPFKSNHLRHLKYKKVKKLQPYSWDYEGNYEEVDLQLFVYNEDHFIEHNEDDWKSIANAYLETKKNENVWFNIHGLSNAALFPEMAEVFDVPKSLLVEVLNLNKRSRVEAQDGVTLMSIKTTLPVLQNDRIEVIPLNFVIKKGRLFSFQEKKNDLFEHIRERIRTKTGNVRKKGIDYLLFLLVEALLENYFILLTGLEDQLERVIQDSKKTHQPTILNEIHLLTENLNDLKRTLIPLKDLLFTLQNADTMEEFDFMEENNLIYFRRLHHKILEIIDQIDYDAAQLDRASNFFFSMQSHRMNQIMKVLTIVSVIFMPLTFVVGVYGMNFDNMPELHYQNGYFIVMAFMVVLTLLMILYFKWKRWF